WHSRVTDPELPWMGEEVHEGDQSAVAPTHNADTLGIELIVVFQHELPASEDIFDLQPAVIDQFPELASVAGAPAIGRSNHRVTLQEQLAKDVDVVGSDVSMNAAMGEHHQR